MYMTKDYIKNAIEKAHKNYLESMSKGYTYFMPSPNEGKRLMIRGFFTPGEVSKMVSDIFTGKAKIEDFECIEEIEV